MLRKPDSPGKPGQALMPVQVQQCHFRKSQGGAFWYYKYVLTVLAGPGKVCHQPLYV